MPAPTMDTFDTLSSATRLVAPSFSVYSFKSSMVSSMRSFSTVKLMSLVPLRPMDWSIMSTLVPFDESFEKIL